MRCFYFIKYFKKKSGKNTLKKKENTNFTSDLRVRTNNSINKKTKYYEKKNNP
jgi:hypothetical protein